MSEKPKPLESKPSTSSAEAANEAFYKWWETEGKPSNDEELPPIETIKERFNVWFEKNQISLKELLCPHWKRLRGSATLDLTVACLADVLFTSLVVGLAPTLVTILVVGGYLDRLCEGWEDDDPSHDNKPIPKKPEEP